MTDIRKGDVFALETTNRTFYAFGTSQPSTASQRWQLAECTSATKDGLVKSYKLRPDYPAHQLRHTPGNPKCWAIVGDNQKRAKEVFATNGDDYTCREGLRSAILSVGLVAAE